MRRWKSVLGWLGSTTLAACAGSGTEADLPRSTAFFSRSFITSAPGAYNWVVIVDDRDDPEAARLRADIKAAFSAGLHQMLAENTDPPVPRDAWLSVDFAAIVVHPSSLGDERWTGPEDDPALRWQTLQADAAGARIFADAFARAVDRRLAPAGTRYAPLDAYRHVFMLLENCVAPNGRRETRLADMPGGGALFLLSTADDDSAEPVAVYRDATKKGCGRDVATRVFVPGVRSPDGGACPPRGTSAWRLATWEPKLFDGYQRCDVVDELTGMFFGRVHGGGRRPNCLAHPIQTGDDGLAACTLHLLHDQRVGCPLSRGWFDPPTADGGTGATTIETARGQRRVCEVRQLDGDDGATCRSGAACPSCPSGFCMRTKPMSWCPGGSRADLHVTGGAMAGPLEGHLTCLLEP